MNKQVVTLGDVVLCDLCNKEYTHSSDSGGFYFSGNAVCPSCAPRMLKNIKKYKEEEYIDSFCPEGMPYAKWVKDVLRGGEPGVIAVYTPD